jgi:hypothetical protein
MSKNLVYCIEKLKLISMIKNEKVRKKFIAEIFDDCLYKALNEISVNTIAKKIPLNIQQKKHLRKHQLTIKKLACYTKNKRRRKNLTVQSGGFLPILIPAVASVLTTLLTK